MDQPTYLPSEDDVLKALHYLRVVLPKFATTENAVKLLNMYNSHLGAIEELHPEELEKILQDLEDH